VCLKCLSLFLSIDILSLHWHPRQKTNISVRTASKYARCAMRMSARDACVTAWMDIARRAEKGISMSWLLRVLHCTCFALISVQTWQSCDEYKLAFVAASYHRLFQNHVF
jgi:hypothetical protein